MANERDEISRRRALAQIAGAAATAATLPGLAGCDAGPRSAATQADAGAEGGATPGADAAATPLEIRGGAQTRAPAPGLKPVRGDGSNPLDYVDTLVIVQMENRSFDHIFGSLSLLEGRVGVDGLAAGMANLDLAGQSVGVHHLDSTWIVDPDPGHGRGACLEQWNQGQNDGFVTQWQSLLSQAEMAEKRTWTMGHHTRPDLPVSYALADAFALCDRWHCSLLAPTWPNRFYSHCATSGGLWANGAPYDGPTPYRALLDAGHTLGVYHAGALWFPLLLLGLGYDEWKDQGLEAFFSEAQAGTLPNVSIVEPDFAFNDDHPPRDPRLGQLFIGSVYEALRQSPQWNRALMVVLYDEHGGFYDHVPPPVVLGEARSAEGFAQLGFRVPGLCCGPLARRGEVVHTLLDHASVPALISRLFDLPFINQRAELAGDLATALSLDLVPDAARPEAPPAPVSEVTHDEAERLLTAAPLQTQPELERYFRKQGRLPEESDRARRRRLERYFASAQRLGVARFR